MKKIFLFDKNLSYFPLSGLSNRKTIHCNENGYYSIYQSDRYGFNNPDKEWDKDKIEFLLVGDSFTYGQCVNVQDTISGNLRKLSNNKKGILNLGAKNKISKGRFLYKLADELNLDKKNLKFTNVDKINLKTYRPKNMAMSVKRIEKIIKKPNKR